MDTHAGDGRDPVPRMPGFLQSSWFATGFLLQEWTGDSGWDISHRVSSKGVVSTVAYKGHGRAGL